MRDILEFAVFALRQPRDAARRVLMFGATPDLVWPVFVLSVALSTLMVAGMSLIVPSAPDQPQIQISPFGFAMLIGVSLLVTAVSLAFAGRIMGGVGTVLQSLLLMSVLQYLLLILQLIQLVLTLVSPTLGGLVFLISLVLTLWLMVNFAAELHGFRSLGQAGFAVFVSFVATAVAFFIVFVIASAGIAGGSLA